MPSLKTLALASVLAAAIAACATTTSPTGRTQVVGGVSQEELNLLGARAFAELKAEKPQSRDASQQREVQCIVSAITRQLPAGWQGQWESAVFADKEPNAFALPGGKVGVYTGIFNVARDQNQLAGVISHEIGHVISRHHDERITRQMGAQGALQLIGAVLEAMGKTDDALADSSSRSVVMPPARDTVSKTSQPLVDVDTASLRTPTAPVAPAETIIVRSERSIHRFTTLGAVPVDVEMLAYQERMAREWQALEERVAQLEAGQPARESTD